MILRTSMDKLPVEFSTYKSKASLSTTAKGENTTLLMPIPDDHAKSVLTARVEAQADVKHV
jgi:hypothetical protein